MIEGLYRAAMLKYPAFGIQLLDAMNIALANPVLTYAAEQEHESVELSCDVSST